MLHKTMIIQIQGERRGGEGGRITGKLKEKSFKKPNN